MLGLSALAIRPSRRR